VLHNNRLPENYGKWGLPGGVLDKGEEPSTGLRRELYEEFQLAVDSVVVLGDWGYRNEIHRVFGCEIDGRIKFYDPDEILAIDWLTYDGVVGLVENGKLHTGFELEAIERFRNQVGK
jgi:8-oxo-dGTP pyrophosphatase MutT (NUDIX family)